MAPTRRQSDVKTRDQSEQPAAAAKGAANGTPARPRRQAANDAKLRLAGAAPPLTHVPESVATPSPPKKVKKNDQGAGGDSGKKQQQPSARKGPGGGRRAKGGVSREFVTDDGDVLRAGEDYYIALDSFDPDRDAADDADEPCEVCGRCDDGGASGGGDMIECGQCLLGFHLRCLRPPLKEIPEGEWLCARCDAGAPPQPPAELVAMWQRLLYGDDVVGLVHVLGFAEASIGGEMTDCAVVRYYARPQDTVTGRQRHHGARELFLTRAAMYEPVDALLRRARVVSPARFAAPDGGVPSDGSLAATDVFVCGYEYDEAWRRFKRRAYAGEARGGGGGGGAAFGGREDDDGCGDDDADGWGWGGGDSESDAFSDDDGEGGGGGAYRPERLRGGGGNAAGRRRRGHGTLEHILGDGRFDGVGADDVPVGAAADAAAAAAASRAPRDPLAEAHAALALASVPPVLPCRDAEKAALAAFVARAIRGDGGVLYVCGVPGTGKTACMTETLAAARPAARAAGAQLVVINCLQLPSPQHVYARLWERLSGQRAGPARAREALQAAFTGGGGSGAARRHAALVVLDEIDMLATRDQAVLYNLFEWPLAPRAKLSVVGISNTHDLDQRVLPRIGSRLTEAKLAFQPYSVQQIGGILRDRLARCSPAAARALDATAVELAARKVASETGDVRCALELLRRATEIAQQEQQQQQQQGGGGGAGGASGSGASGSGGGAGGAVVRSAHVGRAQQELFNAAHMQLLRGTPLLARLLLVGVVLECRATGRGQAVLQAVMRRVQADVCALVDEPPPADGVLQHVAARLAAARLLLADAGHVKARVQLNVGADDVAAVVRGDARLARLHQLVG